MAHQLPWNRAFGTSRTEQSTDFELPPFQGSLGFPYEPNVPGPGEGPAPVPGNASATGYGKPASDGYFGETTECVQYATPNAFGAAESAGISTQPTPTTSNMWTPSASPRPPPVTGHARGYGSSRWTSAFPNRQVHSMSSILRSQPHVALRATALGQRPPVLQSSPRFRTVFNPAAARQAQALCVADTTAPEVPQQPHLQAQAVSRSTLGPRNLVLRPLQYLRSSAKGDINACWPCRNAHKRVSVSSSSTYILGDMRWQCLLLTRCNSATMGPPVRGARLRGKRPFPAVAGRSVMR